MYSQYEVETLARLQREEVARQVAAVRRAAEAARDCTPNRAWRRYLAAALRAVAAWLAPTTAEPTADVEPLVT